MRRRGVTILEAVLATVILGMISVAVAATITYVQKSAENGKHKVHGYEVCSRLMLQWLDDETAMPPQDAPYNDGTYLFTWEVRTDTIEITMPPGSMLQPPLDGNAAQLLKAQKLITVRVYEASAGGSGGAITGPMIAELRRTHNPQSKLAGRNPDANKRLTQNRDRVFGLVQEISRGGTKPTPAPTPTSRQPATNSSGGGGSNR